MSPSHYERAQALAKMALALMTERQVAPTPDNFALFYAYVSGDNPAVARVMGELIAERCTLTPQLLAELRERFFSNSRTEAAVDHIGSEISDAVTNVLSRIKTAQRDAVAYGRTLSAASGELDDATSVEGLQKLVGGLLTATRTMEARTQSLEVELQRSSLEVNELKTKLDDVRRESLIDPLTGIYNRKAFDADLTEAMKQARDTAEPLTLLMCDIDHFKAFNDRWGHTTGDQVLKLVAGCLSENVKGRDTAARYGGEEFAVILRNTALVDAVRLANQIRQFVERKRLVKKSTGDILGTISISIGAAQLGPADTAISLIQRADHCLYAAKDAGRNCVISEAKARIGDDIAAA
ncbi:MAG TPA: GGDEF domain-containing protein [Rhizomicrobium sp.]|nr:GGDEF domain-containing protein [Rhizomicrobium sp.]